MNLSDLTKRIDLGGLYPPFADLYGKALLSAAKRGAVYYAISGHRSADEQHALFLKGRTIAADGSPIITARGQIVTHADAWESDHNYGLAVDSCRDADVDRAGLQPGWKLADYLILAEEGVRVGLRSLYYSTVFKEGPHLGLDIASRGLTRVMLKQAHQRGGMTEAWALLDARGPWL